MGLTKQTYESHIQNDHGDDQARELTFPHVEKVVQKPRLIYPDQNHEENKRVRYIDHVYIEEYGHIQNVVVVVDTDRLPHEVVTWMVKSNTKQEKIKGEIIYDSSKDQK